MADTISGMIFDVRRFSIHDGPGIRTTVFFKGCPLSCWWCHNPESQHMQKEIMFRENRCIRCGNCFEACPEGAVIQQGENFQTDLAVCVQCGICVPTCPAEAREIIGRQASMKEIVEQIERDRSFYEESGGGVTISGGEPLMQPGFLLELLRACKREEFHTALDTCGYASWGVMEELIGLVDLFLYDLKLVDDRAHMLYAGVSNELILANLKKLSDKKVNIHLRVPVIPGITDTEENLCQIGRLAKSLPGVRQVDLLPYHRAASGKYVRLNRSYRLDDIEPPSEAIMSGAAAQVQSYGLQVKIGG